jgi:hypothetical protein
LNFWLKINYGAPEAFNPHKGQGGDFENAEGSLFRDTHFINTTLAPANPRGEKQAKLRQ